MTEWLDQQPLGRLERWLEALIDAEGVDPEAVVAEATRRGLTVTGVTPAERITSLRNQPIETLDALAEAAARREAVRAGVQGVVTNLGGGLAVPAAAADTVGTLTWMIRATSWTMAAYGFETHTESGRDDLRLALLVALGVERLRVDGTRALVRALSREAMRKRSRKAVSASALRRLTRILGTRITRDRVAKAAPLVGGVVGGGLNYALVRTASARTRRHYRELALEWRRDMPTVAATVERDVPVLPPPPPAALPSEIPPR